MIAMRIVLLVTLGLCIAVGASTGTTGDREDDSVRCRLSNICEGTPSENQCTHHRLADSTGIDSLTPLLGVNSSSSSSGLASRRDAILACTFGPASRAARVRDAAAWTWKGYRDCASGKDELQPISCTGQHWFNLSLTAVDGLDTLLLLGLDKEFEEAAELANTHMLPHNAGDCNVFETTIRLLGGLLSAHGLSAKSHPHRSNRFLEMAADLGSRLARGLNSSSGIAFSDVHLSTGSTKGSVFRSSTSEVTTLSLEFTALARLTGQPQFETAAMAVHNALTAAVKQYNGLLPQYVSPANGQMSGSVFMLGARTDSYYEYLLKQWILTGKTDSLMLERYKEAMGAVRARLLRRTRGGGGHQEQQSTTHSSRGMSHSSAQNGAAAAGTPAAGSAAGAAAGGGAAVEDNTNTNRNSNSNTRGGLLYIGEEQNSRPSPKMDHLVCFLPGVLALGDLHGVSTKRPGTNDAPDLEIAAELAHTCYQLYRRTPTGLAPEIVHFTDDSNGSEYPGGHVSDVGGGDYMIKPADAHSLLRPETVESLFIMWKVTGDPQYREQAWAIFRSFERWARVEGFDQCVGADPPAAVRTAAAHVAALAARTAATEMKKNGSSTPSMALQIAGRVAEERIQDLLRNELYLIEDDTEVWAVCTAAAEAAAAATVQILGALRNRSAPETLGNKEGDEHVALAVAAAVEERLAKGGCTPTSPGGGYSSLESVTDIPPTRRDKMESFWLSETLKYLYLIFTEPPDRCLHSSCSEPPSFSSSSASSSTKSSARLPLTKFVFNTEAHPLPIVGPQEASLVHPELLKESILSPYTHGGGAYPEAWDTVEEETESERVNEGEIEGNERRIPLPLHVRERGHHTADSFTMRKDKQGNWEVSQESEVYEDLGHRGYREGEEEEQEIEEEEEEEYHAEL